MQPSSKASHFCKQQRGGRLTERIEAARQSTMTTPNLRLPSAFTAIHRVLNHEIDEYAHVNNTVYLQWLDRIAWAHSAKLGMPLERCLTLRRGMAIRHTRVDYLEAAVVADDLLIATWIIASDGRLRCSRRFEILRIADGKRALEAEIDFFCLNLDTGKPCRFPPKFIEYYAVLPEVAAAYEALPRTLRHVGYGRGVGE